MTLYEKAERGRLKGEVLTTELLNERGFSGGTVFHRAAINGCIKDIPEHLFTVDALNQIDENNNTILHVAVEYGNLKFIPAKILTNALLFTLSIISTSVKPSFNFNRFELIINVPMNNNSLLFEYLFLKIEISF